MRGIPGGMDCINSSGLVGGCLIIKLIGGRQGNFWMTWMISGDGWDRYKHFSRHSDFCNTCIILIIVFSVFILYNTTLEIEIKKPQGKSPGLEPSMIHLLYGKIKKPRKSLPGAEYINLYAGRSKTA